VVAADWSARDARLRRVAPIGAVLLLALLACLSSRQLTYWSSDEKLFRRAIAVTRGNWAAHTSLGTELEIQRRYDEALVEYQAAIAAAPDDVLAHYNLATLYASLGNRSEAIAEYERVLALSPRHVNALNNLAVERIRSGDFADAVALFQRSLALRPESEMIRKNLERARALRDSNPAR
jgi:tetratricopeptide (TPR) repeat protein